MTPSGLDAACAERGTPLLCGHRGAAATHPENTLPSIEAAFAAGCDAVEIDVHVTADGRLAVIHDATVDRTTDGTGEVGSVRAGTLSELDAGSWRGFAGARVPLLEDVLDACRGQAMVLVELKTPAERWPDASLRVADAVDRCQMRTDALLLAFDHGHIATARDAAPWLACVPLCDAVPERVLDLLESLRAAALGLRWSAVDAALCERVHAAGRRVVTWTVDDEAQARRLAALGVDMIITDDPARIGPVLRGLTR